MNEEIWDYIKHKKDYDYSNKSKLCMLFKLIECFTLKLAVSMIMDKW